MVAVMAGGSWYVFGRSNDPVKNARYLLSKGDMRGAQIELRNAVKGNPSNAEAHVRLAQLQLQTSDPVAAEKELKLARDLRYDNKAITPLLAQSYLVQQRFADVLDEIKADGADPAEASKLLVLRAVAQIGLQDAPGARASLDEAQRLAPDNQDAPIGYSSGLHHREEPERGRASGGSGAGDQRPASGRTGAERAAFGR